VNSPRLVLIALRLIAIIILLVAIFLTIKGDREFAGIYARFGVDPWGRYITCTLQIISILLLLIPSTIKLGTIVTMAVTVALLGVHLLTSGSSVLEVYRNLFYLSAILIACCSASLYMRNITGYDERETTEA
jgi:hypothetical protein